ncbi:hypothetical protein [Halosolutus gelatinilyticus]|uniref:hypothetical protein n=1 Tax=Halosolutus gelatinilyticus TaxID=2931975 RepID=UPI001FF25B2A|nr:hypothetical protein [Halosolutus gelatinilyticus]
MNRRTLLAGAGVALTIPFAACLDGVAAGESDDGGDAADVDIPDSPSEYPVNSGGLDEFSPTATYEEVAIGSRRGVADEYRPHDVAVWNAAAEPEIDLRIIDSAAESVVHRETYAIPDDTALVVSLLQPSAYLVEVRVPAAETRHTLRVPCHFFDCNSSVTRIGALDDEEIRSSVLSTTAECSSAEC